jgi:hypothetical protein
MIPSCWCPIRAATWAEDSRARESAEVRAACLAGRALGPGAPFLYVFRFAGAAAFLAYSMSLPQNSIWWRRNWSMTLKTMFDGLAYGAIVGGTFGWLWPR